MYVWPRLPHASARQLYSEAAELDSVTLRDTASTAHPDAAPVAVGGTAVPEEFVRLTQHQIRNLADGLGFPAELTRSDVSTFDQPATRLLYESMHIVPADAADEGVWSFLSLVVLPDVAVWRWPARAEDRILGRPRNVFRRLWWRAETVGVDLIDVPGGLGEDELVNIMERSTLAASPRTARLLASIIVEEGARVAVARSELMRDVAKRLLRQQAVLALDALDDANLQRVVAQCFWESAASMTSVH
jgi:hypothetical protein